MSPNQSSEPPGVTSRLAGGVTTDCQAGPDWTLPQAPDHLREQNDVFTVCHLLYRGTVVDLLTLRDQAFTNEVVSTARSVPELGDVRFVRPELLPVTHLLRPAGCGRKPIVVGRRWSAFAAE